MLQCLPCDVRGIILEARYVHGLLHCRACLGKNYYNLRAKRRRSVVTQNVRAFNILQDIHPSGRPCSNRNSNSSSDRRPMIHIEIILLQLKVYRTKVRSKMKLVHNVTHSDQL